MSWRKRYKVHPVAAMFPMMSSAEIDALAEDIKANGQEELITLWSDGSEEFLLDGRNRMAACRRAGVEPQCAFVEGDPVAYVISKNVRRRHLTPGQVAELLVALAKMETGSADRVSGKGGRGQKNPVKAKALEINETLPEGARVSEPTIKRAIAKAEGKEPKKPKPKKARVQPSLDDEETAAKLTAQLAAIIALHADSDRSSERDAAVAAANRILKPLGVELLARVGRLKREVTSARAYARREWDRTWGGLNAALGRYLELCDELHVDLDEHQERITTAFTKIARARIEKRRNGRAAEVRR
jgi:hypothetical protein